MTKEALAKPWWLLPPGRVHPLWWMGMAGLLLWLDYTAGPDTSFPVIYVIPVSLAAWYSGRWPALALAVTTPLAHVVFYCPTCVKERYPEREKAEVAPTAR